MPGGLVRIWQHESVDSCRLVSKVQVTVGGLVGEYFLGTPWASEYKCIVTGTASLSIVPDNVLSFRTCLSVAHFQQHANAPCRKARLPSNMTETFLFTTRLNSLQSSRASLHVVDWGRGGISIVNAKPTNCSSCVILSCQYGLKSPRGLFSGLGWNRCQNELRQLWGHKRSDLVLIRLADRVACECLVHSFVALWTYD